MILMNCKNAAFSYEGHTAVKNLNFTVNTGDYLCIVGENGSGKSTLMKGLLRLKSPEKGEILVSDGLKPGMVGYLPQQTPVQKDFPASVYEVVLSGRLASRGLKPFYTRGDKEIALENMKRLNILDLKKKCYRELSGGQQQRVLLCRALCAATSILLLDEPVSGLDPVVTQELYQLIAQIHKQGMTIVMISHDIHAAVSYASHILHLKNEQVFFGPVQEYMKTETARKFLGGEQYA